ncbi:MAG: DUF3108 domain-containing protein [Myxococcota bacterium]
MPERSRTKSTRLFLALIAGALVLGFLFFEKPSGDAVRSDAPREGVLERSRYVFDWNGLTAGEAEFTLSRTLEAGTPTLHFNGRARTAEGIDLLWRMRDSVVALIDGRTLGPRRFQLFRRENRKRIDLDMVHDLEEGKFRISRSKGDRVRKGTVPSAGVYDPVSAMLVLRQKRLRPGDAEAIRVLEGKRVYEVTLTSLARERIAQGGRKLRAIKLALTYRSEDGRRSSDADGIRYTHLWVGDTAGHPLLRLKAGAFAGVISGERVAWDDKAARGAENF